MTFLNCDRWVERRKPKNEQNTALKKQTHFFFTTNKPALSLSCTQDFSDYEFGKKEDGGGTGHIKIIQILFNRLRKNCLVLTWEIKKRVRVQLGFFAISLLWLKLGSDLLAQLKMLKTPFSPDWQFGILTWLWSAWFPWRLQSTRGAK